MVPNRTDTNEMLKKLARSAGWWRRFFASQDAGEIHHILSELTPLELAALDLRVRRWNPYAYYSLHNWQNLRPVDVVRLSHSNFADSLLGLASFHYRGYVREAAVKELDSLRTGRELPFLLIRLNDWVPQVRDIAARAVRARIDAAYAIHFLANISLVFRLRDCGRLDKQFVEEVCGLLKCPECKQILMDGMASKDKTVRRLSFQLAAEADPTTLTSVIRAAMTDSDPHARAWAAQHFLPEVSPVDLPPIAESMLRDRYMPVRRDALWALAVKCPDLSAEPLRHALLDGHVAIREIAKHFLNAATGLDVRQFYLDAINRHQETNLAIVIRGLGESGSRQDATLVLPYLAATEPRLRRAATYAIGKLAAEDFSDRLLQILSDEKPGVSREAKKALLPRARQQTVDEFWNLFLTDKRPFVRRNALALILQFGKWEKLPAVLRACSDDNERLAGLAQDALRAWLRNYNSSFTEPTQIDAKRIQEALTYSETRLSRTIVAEIHACLKIYFP